MIQKNVKSPQKLASNGGDRAMEMAAPDLARMTAAMVNGWTELNGHLLSLAQTSLRNNLEAAEELRQCHSPQDLMDAQLRLARKNYEYYLDGARQIGSLMAQVSSDAVQCLTPDGRG